MSRAIKAKTAAGKKSQRVHMHEGQVVKPVLFDGKNTGSGKYMAASIDDVLVINPKTGKPYEYKTFGVLV